MKCSAINCLKDSYSRGMCRPHYMKWWHAGGKDEPKRRDPNGTGTMCPRGYVKFTVDGKQVYEHTLLAEKALGRKLPEGAMVHHTGKTYDNHGPFKLVICPNQDYHMLLHRRAKELGFENN